MDGWISGWMDECKYVNMYVSKDTVSQSCMFVHSCERKIRRGERKKKRRKRERKEKRTKERRGKKEKKEEEKGKKGKGKKKGEKKN